jgi:hypothetical protein
VDGAYGVDGVGVGRGLVLAVALDPGEPERHAAGVARRALHPVEGDLDERTRWWRARGDVTALLTLAPFRVGNLVDQRLSAGVTTAVYADFAERQGWPSKPSTAAFFAALRAAGPATVDGSVWPVIAPDRESWQACGRRVIDDLTGEVLPALDLLSDGEPGSSGPSAATSGPPVRVTWRPST